jgi:hypothetical protein
MMERWKDERAFVPFAAVEARRCESAVLNQDNTVLISKTIEYNLSIPI